jgi:hypothetical protein
VITIRAGATPPNIFGVAPSFMATTGLRNVLDGAVGVGCDPRYVPLHPL